jgi:NAD(P)-dependent dehydrogenase (short-subunit alcohol dehydrogenase family)
MNANGKIALITGGNRGVGFETARELGAKGYTVVLGVRDAAKGEAAAARLRSEGYTAEVVVYDTGRPETDASVRDTLEKKYGKLDVLVNNAGTLQEAVVGQSILTNRPGLLEETFAVNVFAVVRLTLALLPLLKKSEAGRIVNVSSILGSLTLHSTAGSPIAPAKGFAYNASKAALNAFTVHLADALKGTNIKVNSAHPGWVKTDLGGPHATDDVVGSGKTSTDLATLGEDGPTGGFFHKGQSLPW